ncbi:MAG: RsmE family RNA methyltransferase [Candidatus Omnitrophota bacterium]|jgi:16S rRNA (uracil1498-N3)-methyltransferase
MARIYCPEESLRSENIVVNQRAQIHYLCDVLRLKINDHIFVFDGKGNQYDCQIQQLSKKEARLLKKEKINIKLQWKINLAIACALPKQKSRFDDLVDKLSQLGVDRIIPMITERVIVRWDANQRQRHNQRWRKITQQACIQSGRNNLPVIEPIQGIKQILTRAHAYDLKLIPTLMEKKNNLRELLSEPLPRSVLFLIGPEGDFTHQELTQAKTCGFIPVSLGDLILRLDTACIAVTAFFRLYEPR